jgi:HEAT repeat protein
MRAKYSLALGQIGDKKVLPKLEAATKDKKASLTARAETLAGVGLLGDEKNLPLIDGLKKSDPPDGVKKQCLAESGSDAEKACDNLARVWREALEGETARLQAGKECHEDVGCWARKLKDAAWKVRERAVYELGKAGTAEATKALLSTTRDDKTEVRRAVYIALDWATRGSATKELMKQNADALTAQYDEDKKSANLLKVNEDLKRLVWKVQNL